MLLEGSKSSAALSWVREDLDACLATIRDKLETYAEDPSRREPLRAVQEELERLNLTFLTLEQKGASILTDEMIAVGGHMLHNSKVNLDESLAALTDAVIVLPSYLDRLQAGHEDLPILLLPTLNELRATYDESLLSEGMLFAPDLDVIIPELSGCEADAIASNEFASWARRVRNQFQSALLGWLQEQSKDHLLVPLQDVCEKLYIRLGRNELRRLWWIAHLGMEGLRDGSIDNDLPLRRLFARLDLTLKAMAENGEYGPASDTITALSRALLFYAAQARPGSKATDTLRERFRLDELIPDRDALMRARGAVTGRDAELFQSIGEAIREELAQIKDTLDMELRTGRVDSEQRVKSVASLQQLGDTLHMLNLAVPAKAIEGLLHSLEKTNGETDMDLDSPLLALAQKLLVVESILDTHIQLLGEPVEEHQNNGLIALAGHQQRQIVNCMLDECVHSLHQTQDAVMARLAGDTEADFASPLQLISGALQIASQLEVAELTEKLQRVLHAELTASPGGEAGRESKLEPITDAVAALELYLAGCRDEQADSLRYLKIMHARLEGLPEASADGDAMPETAIVLAGIKSQEPTTALPDKAPGPSVPDIPASAISSAGEAVTEEMEPFVAGLTEHEATPAESFRMAAAEQTVTEEPVAEPAETLQEPVQGADTLTIEDGSILSIFLEEATEILERCDTLLNTWRDKLSDQKLVQNLQREIHTFKGGARMAGVEALGNLSHSMETLLERITANRMQATVAAVQALEEGCDRLNIWVEQLQSGRMPEAGNALRRFEKQVATLSVPPLSQAVIQDQPEKRQAEPDGLESDQITFATPPGKISPEKTAAEPATAGQDTREHEREAAPVTHQPITHKPEKIGVLQEPEREFLEIQDRPAAAMDHIDNGTSQAHIRVAAELMDSLVNYAGEISIYRSRLEQQLGSVRYNLKEVETTVSRLKEQLRKLEIETEAQMMSRYQNTSTKDSTEFDPLELDRFSHMQHLSRSLTESVNDLLSLQDMLSDSVRQAESLLTQQSRVSSDLQAGLMQTRMTPFGSAAPRLRRVVRSAVAETGKKARLHLRMVGSSDQLDRNVLERITAPLEHMLRNAVAHGIEKPKTRRKQKKPEEGQITVTVEAEATEFVVRVQDDGAGINLEAVRKRAIQRGMIGRNDPVGTARLIEFILESGFSTSDKVTGLAGRGVGMDVVNSEIKKIGGSMEIDTEPGVGTRFTIRIPFSLAVMQTISVTVDDRQFQIPLNSVAGVARMTPLEYVGLARSESPMYEFAGEQFPLLELEPLLGVPPLPLDSENVSLLMIRSGERKAAFRVSGLQGHQEIVIKPVGPQISSIPGILGGTIAADGQVVIILDMGPLIRRGLEQAIEPVKSMVTPSERTRQPLVMVVDDSITIRKVTSRVLENHSIEVMTARDGLDAIERLHERIPDLMLLDIEMPRMDGYELAQHIRSDARLRHIPIVMITSRSGQKHRKKARDAGANAYLTKPYQEADLIAQVEDMLDLELVMRRSD
ncbi:MAG: response regulator [Xanthomonadales bacterium]